MIPLHLLTRAMIRHIRVNDPGAAVRALLNNDPARIVHAEKLRNAKTLPQTPFIALRRGGVGSGDGIVNQVTYRWFVYDKPDREYWEIDQIAAALAEAYDIDLDDSALVTDRPQANTVGDQSFDEDYGLLLSVVQVTVAGV